MSSERASERAEGRLARWAMQRCFSSGDLRERGIDSSELAAGCLEVIVRGSRAKMSLDAA